MPGDGCRCWSSEDDFKQVHMPTLATSSPPHSSSARGSPRSTRLSHALLRGAQVAVLALLGAREDLEHHLARLKLLYNIIGRSIGRFARAGAPLNPCGARSSMCTCAWLRCGLRINLRMRNRKYVCPSWF
jgi:hypothetical protein